jgi:hypothetical protein
MRAHSRRVPLRLATPGNSTVIESHPRMPSHHEASNEHMECSGFRLPDQRVSSRGEALVAVSIGPVRIIDDQYVRTAHSHSPPFES